MSCCTCTVFPPPVSPVLSYLRSMKQACTIAVLNSHPRKYWWLLLHHYAKEHLKWPLLEMVMYSLYLRLRVGSHTPEFRAIFWYSRLCFRWISRYELGLTSSVEFSSSLTSIQVYVSLRTSVLFGRNFL